MKIIRYSTSDGAARFGTYLDGQVSDLSASYDGFADLLAGAEGAARGRAASAITVDRASILPPVDRRSKVLCMAVNYRSHIREMQTAETKEPILFTKFYDSLTGPYSQIPRFGISEIMDYEGELAVVLGKRARSVSRAEAWDCVLGYTVVNDISARSLFRVPQGTGTMLDWFSCKAMDRSTPVGPWIVTPDEAGDFTSLRIETFLNGDRVQSEGVSDMVFDIPRIIEHASSRVTLEPGDVISTGTPSGVGVSRKRTLQKGDVVKVQVEGIGHLENEIV